MKRVLRYITVPLACLAAASCVPVDPSFVVLPIETRFSFLNFSTRYYAVLGIREHTDSGGPFEFRYSPLLAPGATIRSNFTEFTGSANPTSLDLRLLLYRRVNDDVPIGLDETEAVELAPIVAGEVFDVPAASVQTLETYTIVNWDAPAGVGRVKIAQCSLVDQAIRDSGRFANDDAAWEIVGVDPDLASVPPPALADDAPITGRVVLTDGTPLEGIGVLIRTQFRTSLDCADPGNDDDTGYSAPIAFTITDDAGAFQLDRPAGVYQVEFFSDDYAFRPGILRVETPLEDITVLAEPL